MRKFVTVATALCLGMVLAVDARAQTEFPERNIDLIIPYGPGGGFDIYARAVGTTMARHLGGNVKIVPRNVPGGAAVKGLTSLYRAAPDGYTFGIVPLPGGLQPSLIGRAVDYDLDKMTWLGVVNIGVYSLVVSKDSAFKTLDNIVKGEPRIPFIATTGTNDHAMVKIVMDALGGKANYLSTFRGAPEALLAVVRGEADVALGIGETIAPFVASGDLKQLVWFQRKGSPGAPADVPTAEDIGYPQLANIGLYRVFAAPPGVAGPVRDKLVNALQATLKDPEFLEWSAKANFPIDPGTPEDARRLYEEQKAFLMQHVELLKPEAKTSP